MVETGYNKFYTKAYKAMPRARRHIGDSWSFEMDPIELGRVHDSDLFVLAVKIQ